MVSGSAWAAIAGTAHDFSDGTVQTGYNVGEAWAGGEMCGVCHAPHLAPANTGSTSLPLWNRAGDASTAASFTMYPTGGTIDGAIDATPNAVSQVCLSCHDGSIALDAFGGAATGTVTITTGDTVLVDNDFTDDHPISIVYSATDTGLVASGTLPATITLFGGKVECGTCHDVHDAGNEKLLAETNVGSVLCTTCHVK